MPSQEFFTHRLGNGLTLIGEKMDAVSSAAFSILVPLGAATDPDGLEGSSALLAEMFNKGAGAWNAKQLSGEFEALGIHRSHSSGIEVSIFSGACLGENLERALEIYSEVLFRPHLPSEELISVKELALQDLRALEDEPSSKVMSELAKVFYPAPFGRSQLGTVEGINAVDIASLRDYYEREFLSSSVIIAVAGDFDWERIVAVVERLYGSFSGTRALLDVGAFSPDDKAHHLQRQTSQLQVALAYPSVSLGDPDYYAAKVAVSLLSGGMCGRLFVEVREKRGLVYRVSASHSAARSRSAVFASAGTTPENAKETLSVMLSELRGVGQGISEEELLRAKADLKSRVIMQSELTSVRASALVNDWWNLGSLRTIKEVKQGIDSVTSEQIAAHVERHPVSPITLATLGPVSLELNS